MFGRSNMYEDNSLYGDIRPEYLPNYQIMEKEKQTLVKENEKVQKEINNLRKENELLKLSEEVTRDDYLKNREDVSLYKDKIYKLEKEIKRI